MKKTYLAPMSETLMAILQETCQNPEIPTGNPSGLEGVSGSNLGPVTAPKFSGSHSL